MITVFRIRRWVVSSVLLAALAGSARGAPPATYSHAHNLLGEAIGAAGYDVVSYFPEGGGRPRKGLIGISTELDGVTYRFATKGDLALFQKSPGKYLPAYGGWCAWAVGEIDKRVDVDPESYDLRGGRLYLFYKDPGLDARALWLKKPTELIQRADANWPALSQ
jgi:hypothetical protein